ncbi:MAG TPA: hypothetical protein VGH19_06605 [Verrucomicrobiae bacterium]
MSVHVVPNNDDRQHSAVSCWCDPKIEYLDPENGMPYEKGPLVTHNSMDCRESVERLLKEGVDKDKDWACVSVEDGVYDESHRFPMEMKAES